MLVTVMEHWNARKTLLPEMLLSGYCSEKNSRGTDGMKIVKILKSGSSLAHSSEDQPTMGQVLHYNSCVCLLRYRFSLTLHHKMQYENSDHRVLVNLLKFGKDFPLGRSHP